MRHRTAQTIFPCGVPSDYLVGISTWRVPVSTAGPSIYDAVGFLERLLFCGSLGAPARIEERIPLGNVVTLHNVDGMRDVAQIEGMIRQIQTGGDILHPSGLPNVKVVVTGDNERVLFDGHHTVIAYMAAGRNYLDEIPNLIVHDGQGWIADREILVFFGPHSRDLTASNWREHVINWQAPYDRQVCKRVQQNAGELFDSLVKTGALSAAMASDACFK